MGTSISKISFCSLKIEGFIFIRLLEDVDYIVERLRGLIGTMDGTCTKIKSRNSGSFEITRNGF